MSEPLKLVLNDRKGRDLSFRVDIDNELEIEMDDADDAYTAWLTVAEGKQLLELLTKWLVK
jgi:hypothetical protein